MAYVYRHRKSTDHSVFYVGISKQDYLRKDTSHNRSDFWKKTVDKYGFYSEVIVENITYEDAKDLEKLLIKEYGRRDLSTGQLVNLTDGGEGVENPRYYKRGDGFLGKKHSEKNKEKWSKQLSGIAPIKAIKKRSKGVFCGINNKSYESISCCSRDLGVSQPYLSMMLNSKRENRFKIRLK